MYKILGGDGKEYGPISADTLKQWIAEGRANAQTQVQFEGSSAWTALGMVPEFVGIFAAATNRGVISSSMPNDLPAPPVMNPLALIGFILSIVSATVGLCCCYGFPFNIAGIVCSVIGLVQIRKQPERYSGRGLAIAGVILGIASIILAGVFLLLGVALSWSDIQRDWGRL